MDYVKILIGPIITVLFAALPIIVTFGRLSQRIEQYSQAQERLFNKLEENAVRLGRMELRQEKFITADDCKECKKRGSDLRQALQDKLCDDLRGLDGKISKLQDSVNSIATEYVKLQVAQRYLHREQSDGAVDSR